MKPIFHGLDQLRGSEVIVKVPCERIDLDSLIQTFENNLDKRLPEDWLGNYKQIAPLYHHLYADGEIPVELVYDMDDSIVEMATECIDDDLEDILFEAATSSGRNYHYEYCRSVGAEQMASNLTEFIDEDCDFI